MFIERSRAGLPPGGQPEPLTLQPTTRLGRFKLAPPFPDLDAWDARFVQGCATP
jgi:hypothetical protein